MDKYADAVVGWADNRTDNHIIKAINGSIDVWENPNGAKCAPRDIDGPENPDGTKCAPHEISSDINANVRLFSYIVTDDYGFAPNPFYGVCTLATCKPEIRKEASVRDWVIGTGSKRKCKQGRLVYVMRVTETMTFNEYWKDDRFQRKKPNLRGSWKQASGDNIYFWDDKKWQQQKSYHGCDDVKHDTQTNRVLLSTKKYAYWGGSGPKIPKEFRDYNGVDICTGRG